MGSPGSSPLRGAPSGRRQLAPASVLLVALAALSCGRGRGSSPEVRVGVAPSTAPRPNIIVLHTDDHGYADLGSYGGNIPTPHLDALAAEGVRFTRYYGAAPLCTPSRFGLLTGANPGRSIHGFYRNEYEGEETRIDDREKTIAERLRAVGYRTAAFGKWHLGRDRREYWPDRRGFEVWSGFHGHSVKSNNDPAPYIVKGQPAAVKGYVTDIITKHALEYLDERRADPAPFFMYVAVNTPHFPIEAPEIWEKRFAHVPDKMRRHYAAMIANLDDNVGQLLARLRDTGKQTNTLVWFAGDHGGDPKFGADNGALSGGKRTRYEGGLRTVGIVSWPGRISPAVSHQVVSGLDLVPTVARLAGTPLGGAQPVDGVDLGPVLFLGKPIERGLYFGPELDVYKDPKKERPVYIRGPWKLWGDALYDLESDPKEATNVAPRRAEVVAELRRAMASEEQAIASGRWLQERGSRSDAKAITYQIELEDPLTAAASVDGAASKQVSGGAFDGEGWQATSNDDHIVIELARPFGPSDAGALEIEVLGFRPEVQYAPESDAVIAKGGFRYHFFGIGAHPENRTGKTSFALLRGGARYGRGFKLFYAAAGSPKSQTQGGEIVVAEDWRWSANPQRMRIEWTPSEIRLVVSGAELYRAARFGGRTESLRYVWIGRDRFRSLGWPALRGPRFRKLRVYRAAALADRR